MLHKRKTMGAPRSYQTVTISPEGACSKYMSAPRARASGSIGMTTRESIEIAKSSLQAETRLCRC